ncbi:MAG: hypothetical protein U9P38_08735, partial [Campylobacterota bacterium]|nr:hypothetical protein [Campylobacterota bacterium]
VFKQNQNSSLKINFYLSSIDDMITKDSNTKQYVQDSKNEFIGTELEYIYLPNNQTELNFLTSYIQSRDDDGEDLADVANFLASSTLIYEFKSGFTLGSVLQYISSSKRFVGDDRDDMDDSVIFNQTLSYSFKSFISSLVVKDLFDSNRYYSLAKNVYETDFDDGGRAITLNILLEF